MEERVLLKRSPKGLWAQICSMLVAVLVIGLFATVLIAVIFNFADNGGLYLVLLTWFILLGGWAIGALKLWLDWRIKRYEIADEALIVHAKAGQWGTAQTIYRYESIISVQMRQGFWGKRFGFGDVEVVIPKIEHPIIMNDIEDPLNQIAAIQRRMDEKGSGASHAFIT